MREPGKPPPDRWTTLRLFLMPFCVSSFSQLIKGKGFVLVFPPDAHEIAVSLGACAAFVVAVLAIKRLCAARRMMRALPGHAGSIGGRAHGSRARAPARLVVREHVRELRRIIPCACPADFRRDDRRDSGRRPRDRRQLARSRAGIARRAAAARHARRPDLDVAARALLVDAGFSVLLIDQQAHGETLGERITLGC